MVLLLSCFLLVPAIRTLAANEGSDRKVVLKRTKVNLPKATKFHTIVPQPLFMYKVKFTTPFVWNTPRGWLKTPAARLSC